MMHTDGDAVWRPTPSHGGKKDTAATVIRAVCATILLVALVACATPDPDAQLLDQVRAELDVPYGLAPLLLHDDARVAVALHPQTGQEVAVLDHPDQPADPARWLAHDCFASAYAVRAALADVDHVADVALGEVEFSTDIGDDYQNVTTRHVCALIVFTDSHTITVDLTPLAAEPLASRCDPTHVERDGDTIEQQFDNWRRYILLDKPQPMAVVEQDGQLYYLLAGALIHADAYEFALRGYPLQPATRDQPLQLGPGAIAGLVFKRSGFAETQALVAADGPQAFNVKSHLLIRAGDDDPTLAAVLDDHLYLLWHLVTKFEEPVAEEGS
jgi:hypothetical protein